MGSISGSCRSAPREYAQGGLWTIEFGVGGSNGDPETFYFTDRINGEADGLYGAITSQ
jgi:hypothetical protein